MQGQGLGIDIGGVIISRIDDTRDTSFHTDFLKTPAVAGAFEAIRALVDGPFGKQVHLVSKCGPKVEEMTRQWLEDRGFFERTGVPEGHVHFCRERAQKSGICEAMGITHFVDDRLEVLSHLGTVTHRYLFQPRPEELARFARHLKDVREVQTWSEIRDELIGPPA